MKTIYKIIIAVLIVALVGFTAFYIVYAYNSGKIGNKAEKIADKFSTEIEGTWNGSYSISSLTFSEGNKVSITMIGVSLDGTYSDTYDLEKDEHMLTIQYSSSVGISVTRNFTALIENEQLTLIDKDVNSIKLTYTKAGAAATSTQAGETTTVYSPGIDVVEANVLGKWISTTNSNSSYTFVDSSRVTITILGASYDGTYSISSEETTGKYLIKIDYANIVGVNFSNSYYLSIEGESMTLQQKGAESLSTTYTRQPA